ncbi:MAG: riboflavin synthase [SAR202 cluster bacterium]|nr:riboflavin synthase [SAR202 cluster bacterium]|tara:strand:- start:4204 stop:4806 length:603 start_codon:yes stop_codon:yes gene_type:complete
MFSGIIEEIGTVDSYDGERLVIQAKQVLDDLKISQSIMIDGACLTVFEISNTNCTFTVETIPETRYRTNFGKLIPGDHVNLERALRYGDRVGGHMVQGHVDGVGTVRSISGDANSNLVVIEADQNIIAGIVEKGFIAVNGISLTVANCNGNEFSIAIIPYTLENTTVHELSKDSQVNLEVDVTAKYISKLLERYKNDFLP